MATFPRDFLHALQALPHRRTPRRTQGSKEWTTLVERHMTISERREAFYKIKHKKPFKDSTKQPDYCNPRVTPGPNAYIEMQMQIEIDSLRAFKRWALSDD